MFVEFSLSKFLSQVSYCFDLFLLKKVTDSSPVGDRRTDELEVALKFEIVLCWVTKFGKNLHIFSFVPKGISTQLELKKVKILWAWKNCGQRILCFVFIMSSSVTLSSLYAYFYLFFPHAVHDVLQICPFKKVKSQSCLVISAAIRDKALKSYLLLGGTANFFPLMRSPLRLCGEKKKKAKDNGGTGSYISKALACFLQMDKNQWIF